MVFVYSVGISSQQLLTVLLSALDVANEGRLALQAGRKMGEIQITLHWHLLGVPALLLGSSGYGCGVIVSKAVFGQLFSNLHLFSKLMHHPVSH